MRIVFTCLAYLLPILLFAQSPQFAVVRPNGTTSVCPTLDSAYNKAFSGDHIYLPGGSFSLGMPITKSIHLHGAGYNEDSSKATGITILPANLILGSGCDNGSIEGIYFTPSNSNASPSIVFELTNNISNYIISSCNLTDGVRFSSSTGTTTISNLILRNCNIGQYSNYVYGYQFGSLSGGYLINSLISNNIIRYSVNVGAGNKFSNNIFFLSSSSAAGSSGSTYENNIFQTPVGGNSCSNSTFNNNVNAAPNINYGNVGSANISEAFDVSFINPGPPNGNYVYAYEVHHSYKVKSTSAAKNSGTDGTDRGIYGGLFPWIDGSIPSNPHIYFKKVDAQTGADGKLHIEFKIRTNN